MLDGVNLDIQQGEVLALLGEVARAKRHVLRHIIGLQRPDQRDYVQGVDINNCSTGTQGSPARHGRKFQGSALFGSMTVEETSTACELTSLADPVIEIMTYIKLAAVGLGDAGNSFTGVRRDEKTCSGSPGYRTD